MQATHSLCWLLFRLLLNRTPELPRGSQNEWRYSAATATAEQDYHQSYAEEHANLHHNDDDDYLDFHRTYDESFTYPPWY